MTPILLNNDPKVQEKWDGSSDTPERSSTELPLGMKLKILNKKKKILYPKVAKIYSKSKFICEVVKKNKTFVLVLLSHLKLKRLGKSSYQGMVRVQLRRKRH